MNTDALWPTSNLAWDRVLEIQTKLHRWARREEERQFDDLYNLVYDPAFLTIAWEQVKANKGARSAGVDGKTVRLIEMHDIGSIGFLENLRHELKSRTFQPQPVRERMIPKPGTTKRRRLGIPTVHDRVVQASLKLLLEPIFEADFFTSSYGFRPKRRAQDAIAEIHYLGSRTYEWVLEADIEGCFDSIDHTALMQRIRRRIGDKRVLTLIKAFLKAGVLTEAGTSETTITGTPQGGILSPLLANIALSALDDYFEGAWEAMGSSTRRKTLRKRGGATYRLIRYADDFVVMVAGTREHAVALRTDVALALSPMGLRLSEAKTRVVHLDEGFDFLGFHIQRRLKRGSTKRHIYTYPSQRAVKSVKQKVRWLTHRSIPIPPRRLLLSINSVMRGWCNYFRHGVSKRTFSYLSFYAWRRVANWLRKRHDGLSWKALRRRFIKGSWTIVVEGCALFDPSSVPVTRYRFRGKKIVSHWDAPTLESAGTYPSA